MLQAAHWSLVQALTLAERLVAGQVEARVEPVVSGWAGTLVGPLVPGQAEALVWAGVI